MGASLQSATGGVWWRVLRSGCLDLVNPARYRPSDSEARSRAGSLGGVWGPCRRILHLPNGVLHAAGLSRAQRSESVQVTSALVFGLRIGRIGSSWGALTRCTMQEVTMTELLDLTVDAHGGLARWNEVTAIQAALSITGAIWYVKGQPDVLKDIVMVADTRRERVRTSFVNDDRQSVFEPDRVVVETKDGTLVESREDPERSFEGQVQDTPWDAIHVAYFSGEALWTYLNTPFIYTQERFRTEEIGSIQADGETWRRLKVTFPEEVKSHSREQIFCIGPDGLLRRHDYTVDILGGATGLNYASEYRDVDGIVFPPSGASTATKATTGLCRSPSSSGSTLARSPSHDPVAGGDGPADRGFCVAESIAVLQGPLADVMSERLHRSVAYQPVR